MDHTAKQVPLRIAATATAVVLALIPVSTAQAQVSTPAEQVAAP